MTRAEKWTLRFWAAMVLAGLVGVGYGIFGHGPRYALVLLSIGWAASALRFAEVADIALRGVVRKAEERPEGRR